MKASLLGGLRKFLSIVAMTGLAVCATVQPVNAQVTTDIFAGFIPAGDGTPFSGFVGTLSTPGITFATDNGYAWHPFGLGSFGAHSYGTLSVAATGVHTFVLDSDDGSKLFIDGFLVIDNGGAHGPFAVSGSVFLTAGLHTLDVNFWEDFGGPSGVDLHLAPGTMFVSGVVPEPETYAMLLAGLGLLGFAARRRKLQAA